MYSLVVDASVAIKWLNPHEVLADKARALYDDYEQGQFSLLVPAFWDYEVVNGISKAIARGDLTEQEGHEAIALLSAVQTKRFPYLRLRRAIIWPVNTRGASTIVGICRWQKRQVASSGLLIGSSTTP